MNAIHLKKCKSLSRTILTQVYGCSETSARCWRHESVSCQHKAVTAHSALLKSHKQEFDLEISVGCLINVFVMFMAKEMKKCNWLMGHLAGMSDGFSLPVSIMWAARIGLCLMYEVQKKILQCSVFFSHKLPLNIISLFCAPIHLVYWLGVSYIFDFMPKVQAQSFIIWP